MQHPFFTGPQEHFFRPLTHGDRECCASVLRNLFDRIHGPNADYSEALTREALAQKVAWGEFNEFIDKRFAKEYAVRLVADSAVFA